MDFDQLESFCVVAVQKSFRKAADILRITQPAVTRRIQSLEDELGVPLLIRSPQSVSLTPQGAAFLPYAERTLKIVAEGRRKALSEVGEGHFTIAASFSTTLYLLPRLLEAFRQIDSSRVDIYTQPSPKVHEMVLDQSVDLGFTSAVFSHPLLHYEKVHEEELWCVGHPELVERHFGEGRQSKRPIPIIHINIGTSPWSEISKLVADHPMFEFVVRTDFSKLASLLVDKGVGMAFLPVSEVLPSLKEGRVARAPIEFPDAALPKRSIYLVSYKDRPLSPGAVKFMQTARLGLNRT